MKNKGLILSAGLAMFSMFFGSGNLVFPLLVGQWSQGHYGMAFLGIFVTGVVVPFLGILAMMLFKGDQNAFFQRMGRWAPFLFPLFALSLMGPFGVLARCITVAHGAFSLLAPSCSLWAFSLVSCGAIFLLTIAKSRIVAVLGNVLTPVLLAALAAIALFGLSSVPLPDAASEGSWKSFVLGIVQGYQTMDLLAAFFFSAFLIRYLESKELDASRTVPIFFQSSLIGAGLLAAVYWMLVVLGAAYAPMLKGVPDQALLGHVAQLALGSWAAPVVCVAVILACLTTAIVLTSLFADFLRKEISRNAISPIVALVTTLAIAFWMSTLQFSGIMKFLGPILEFTYPALIVMTVAAICHKLFGFKAIRMPVAVAILLKLFSAL
jgi:LIVCS family branched-chain amino acid:cation transporter